MSARADLSSRRLFTGAGGEINDYFHSGRKLQRRAGPPGAESLSTSSRVAAKRAISKNKQEQLEEADEERTSILQWNSASLAARIVRGRDR